MAIGFVFALGGFAIILYAIWTSQSIPLNTLTLTGVGVAGFGVATGAIGLDRGERAARG
ncbi:MAG: hypothetical protein L3J91_00110 [Thermoplasmata archaeon]|nr:hypothetical protein [Thermoplasmata archaeon]